jgi:LytS/YehU family sensor histidine kinase
MNRLPALLHSVLIWVPVWGLYALLIGPANPIHPNASVAASLATAFRSIAVAALLGTLVRRLTERVPWPSRFTVSFAATHLGAAAAYATAWFLIASNVENLLHPGAIHAYHAMLVPNLVIGTWLYLMIAGTVYASRASERAVRAEATAARSQLATLRAQLNPHFLFNALHTVVHLIPERPDAAARAAEQVAGLLRTSIEEDRDAIPLGEELDFVHRYLDVERLRFGDRLRVREDVSPDARDVEVPSFGLQVLVENAIRHGAAPRVDPTTVSISAARQDGTLVLRVSDDGAGSSETSLATTEGTGLRRLRDRIRALYGDQARLDVETAEGRGFAATLRIPVSDE